MSHILCLPYSSTYLKLKAFQYFNIQAGSTEQPTLPICHVFVVLRNLSVVSLNWNVYYAVPLLTTAKINVCNIMDGLLWIW